MEGSKDHNPRLTRPDHLLTSPTYASVQLNMLNGCVYDGRMIDQKLSEYFSAMGRKSAKARMKKISAKRRSEIARNAVKARWMKKKRRSV